MMPKTSKSCPWGACLFILLLAAVSDASAQAQLFTSHTRSPEARAQLYSEIADEVAQLEARGNILKKVVRLVNPTVVHIEAKKKETTASNRSKTVEEAGSGVIVRISDRLYVLTNRHVIKDTSPEDITIILDDGHELHPTGAVEDVATDVAVLTIATTLPLTPARLGDSDTVEIGDFVVAVGSPFGLSHSVTYGIISAKGRRNLELGDSGVRYQDFLQTDAAINPGNSGGPLINLRGEVIAVNTAIASNSGGNDGIGFAIPINMAILVAEQLVERGHVERAFLGVRLDSSYGPTMAAQMGLPRPIGARVTSITPGSPAAEGDIQIGDIILQFKGVVVEDDSHLVNLVSLTPVGQEVEVVVFRTGQALRLNVNVAVRTSSQ